MDHFSAPLSIFPSFFISLEEACIVRYCNLPFFPLLQGKLYTTMEISRAFDQIFKEHLDGVYVFYMCFIFINCVYLSGV